MARYAYGVDMRVVFDPYNREHTKRSFRTSYDEAGQKCVSGIFDVILSKVSCACYASLTLPIFLEFFLFDRILRFGKPRNFVDLTTGNTRTPHQSQLRTYKSTVIRVA